MRVDQFAEHYALLKNWGPRNFVSFIILPPQDLHGYFGLCVKQPTASGVEKLVEARNYCLPNIDNARGGGIQLFLADGEVYRVDSYPIVPAPYTAPWRAAPQNTLHQDVYTFMGPNRPSDSHYFDILEITDKMFGLQEANILKRLREFLDSNTIPF